jgi:YD repeat-containing protein
VPVVNNFDINKALPLGRCEFCAGNPIYPLTGVKKEYVATGIGIGGLSLSLTYDTTLKVPANQADTASALVEPNSFGALWKSSFHHRLVISTGAARALLSRGDGKVISFIGNGAGVYTTNADNTHKLVSIAGGYRFTDVATGDQEIYDSTGVLQSLARGNGMVLSFSYGGKNLTRVQASDGRVLRFSYTNNLISQITDPSGRTIVPAYDANRNLVSLTWQDGKVSQFLYENAAFPWALTGKIDENNSRYATFTYDAQGRAITSEHAGGVERYSVSYTQAPKLVVTDAFNTSTGVLSRQHSWQMPSGTTLELPNGQSSTLAAANVMGSPSVTSQSQPAGSGHAAAASALSYDSNGNIASEDDFNGQRSCFTNDLSRNLPIVAVEGLPNTASCTTVLASNASLPAGSRKVSRQWHPDWSLTTKIVQPLKIINSIYNGQPDPFNSNALASCAPVTAKMPDGKPIAVLCKQVEQATTDVDGSLGLAATLNGDVAPRVSTHTYDAFGRILTGTDPMGRVTTYARYNNSTSFTDPSISSDSDFDSVSLLLHGDGADNSTVVTDSSPSPKSVVTAGNARISTAQSKFGGASIYFDGAGDFLSIPQSSGWEFGSGAFTVEAWVHHLARPTTAWQQVVGNIDDAGTGGWRILVGVTGQVHFSWYDPSGTAQGISTANNVIPLNQWSHIAVSTGGGMATIFINGVSQAVFSNPGIDTSTKPLLIGSTNTTVWFWNGYLDDIRISKGVARYTANFTPPAQVFPNSVPVIDPNAVGHTVGDLQSITNASGRVTQFTLYDSAGRVKQMVDPNGVVTDTAYTPRGRISSATVTPPGAAARTTSYTYDNAGQLTGVTLPDATTMSYSYDAAHRLTGVTDTKGNSVIYTLDAMGNRTDEQVKDPSGILQRNITRVYDALNRVQQVTGASN